MTKEIHVGDKVECGGGDTIWTVWELKKFQPETEIVEIAMIYNEDDEVRFLNVGLLTKVWEPKWRTDPLPARP